MIKLSIILPCYNVSQYLNRCFESIYTQDINYSYEVIAVNDCSTDDTLLKLQELSNTYPNVKVINKTRNGKLTAARSKGISVAQGDYIMHIDPDDFLLPNSLTDIFNYTDNWDILIMNIECQRSDKIQTYPLYSLKSQRQFNMINKKHRRKLFSMIKGSCFAKVIKADLCNNLIYSNYHYNIGEDFAWNFEIFNKAETILYVPQLSYSYQYNSFSLDRSGFNVDRLDVKESWVSNVLSVIHNNGHIYNESKTEIIKSIERYSIGLLLKINKEPNDIKMQLFEKWKLFFANQISLYGKLKQKWYHLLLTFKSFKLCYIMFIMSLGQISPLLERIKRTINIYI